MKKSLIALAVLAASSGAALAQSSVTLFGVVDATYKYGSGSIANKSQLGNSGNSSSRVGFKGVEDLGGGLSASFVLDAGVNNDNGTGATTSVNNQTDTTGDGLIFNRQSTVSLSGTSFGEIRLGRDLTPHFMNLSVFDPFSTNGVGTTQTYMSGIGGPTRVRASNSIGYFLPDNLGGFYGQAMYYLGENASNTTNKRDGNGLSFRAGFKNGPIDVAGAFAETKYATGNIRTMNFGGLYDLKVAKIIGQYAQDKIARGAKGQGFLIGSQIPVGDVGQVRVSFSTYKVDNAGAIDPRSNKLAAGYVHNLSKRTAVYTTIARVANKNGASSALNGASTGVGSNSNGYDLGIRHSF